MYAKEVYVEEGLGNQDGQSIFRLIGRYSFKDAFDCRCLVFHFDTNVYNIKYQLSNEKRGSIFLWSLH